MRRTRRRRGARRRPRCTSGGAAGAFLDRRQSWFGRRQTLAVGSTARPHAIISEDCVPNPPTEFGQSGSSNLSKLLHRKYSSSDCTGTLASTTQIIADECVQIGKEGQIAACGVRTGRQRLSFVSTGQKLRNRGQPYRVAKHLRAGRKARTPGNWSVLNDLKLIAQKAGGSNCSETEVFRYSNLLRMLRVRQRAFQIVIHAPFDRCRRIFACLTFYQ